MAVKILIADDEEDILQFLSYNLKKEGYEVITATNGADALKLAKKENPDLIVLDIMMPVMDGMETCKELRELPETKDKLIVFLTARSEDYSQIAGFENGADDYITKPIKPKLFISRIKALLRRAQTTETNTIIEFGNIKIDKEKHQVIKNGEVLELPKKEFMLLELLASKPGKVFSREIILEKVWGEDVIVGERTIDVHIRKIREKIGEDYIKTVKGLGYKLEY
ncbi:MAG TPA: response regulator transcription factor [Bacteroidia bacterium]|jgi:two-component system alkaline phosphatase synthesis response regulator PhoP|nr:response regulator transcription factor [Bacteroidia bacterium]